MSRTLACCVASLLIASAFHLTSSAQVAKVVPLPSEEWTPGAKLMLAHALQVESGTDNPADWGAIPWVLARRWRMQRQGWTFQEQTRRYCSPLRLGARTPRQRQIMAQAWADVPSRVRATVEAWGRGEVADPCRGVAVHWAAPWLRSPLRVVQCGATENTYYQAP